MGYSDTDRRFGDLGFGIATGSVYFKWLKVNKNWISYRAPTEREDYGFKVDRIISIHRPDEKFASETLVQEHYRRHKAAQWDDITITETTEQGNAAEFYVGRSHFLVYGVLNEALTAFLKFVVVPWGELILGIQNDTIPYEREWNLNKKVWFRTVEIAAIERAGINVWRWTNGDR